MRLGPVSVTVAVAFAVGAAVLVAGLAVQRVALSAPDSATLTALRTATWLGRYRLVESTFSVNGGPTLHGRCLQDWYVAAGSRRRGAELRLDDGLVLLDVPPHTLVATGGTAADRSAAPLVLLELAGCPRVLERRVETLAQRREGLALSGHVLRFALKGTRVSMTLDPATARPAAIAVDSAHAHGKSRLSYGRVTEQVRKAFRAASARR